MNNGQTESIVYRIMDIVEGTSVDGPGLRTAIYFAGCEHRCHGCHNPQTWPHDAGQDMTLSQLIEIIRKADFNVTLTGGDPVYQAYKLFPLVKAIRDLGKTIWLYTGFLFEEISEMESAKDWLPLIEVVVDGPYIENLRDISLAFRGSSNQRIIRI